MLPDFFPLQFSVTLRSRPLLAGKSTAGWRDYLVPATKTEIYSTMNDVFEVWSRSGENLEVFACVVLEIQSLETQRVG